MFHQIHNYLMQIIKIYSIPNMTRQPQAQCKGLPTRSQRLKTLKKFQNSRPSPTFSSIPSLSWKPQAQHSHFVFYCLQQNGISHCGVPKHVHRSGGHLLHYTWKSSSRMVVNHRFSRNSDNYSRYHWTCIND